MKTWKRGQETWFLTARNKCEKLKYFLWERGIMRHNYRGRWLYGSQSGVQRIFRFCLNELETTTLLNVMDNNCIQLLYYYENLIFLKKKLMAPNVGLYIIFNFLFFYYFFFLI